MGNALLTPLIMCCVAIISPPEHHKQAHPEELLTNAA